MQLAVVIKKIRARDPRFDPITHPDQTLRGFFSAWQRALFTEALVIDRNFGAISVDPVIALPLAVFADGAALPAHQHIVGATYSPPAPPPPPPGPHPPFPTALPIDLRRYEDRLTPRLWPSAYVLGNRLFLMGDHSLWEVGTIDVKYTPVCAEIDGLAPAPVDFVLPDEAEEAAVTAGVLFLSERVVPALPVEKISQRRTEAREARATFLKGVENALSYEQR